MNLTYQIEDDGDSFQVLLFRDHKQVAGALVPNEEGDDKALLDALTIGRAWEKSGGGWGGVRPM